MTGNAPSRHTVASYERRWRQWQAFADHHGVSALPADPECVAAFVVARLAVGVSPSGVAANLSAVGWFHAQRVPPVVGVVGPARRVLRVLEKAGPSRPLAPAPVLSVGALEAMVRVPMRQSRQRCARLLRSLTGAPPRQLMAVRADDVVFGPGGGWVEVRLPAVPATRTRPAVAMVTCRFDAGVTIVGCPVEALRALIEDPAGDTLMNAKAVHGNSRLQDDPFDPGRAVSALIAARNRAIVGVGYGGALRVEELSAARVEHLDPVGDGYRLGLPLTKTSRDGHREVVVVERGDGGLDPVGLLDGWLAVRGDHDGPLFHNLHHRTEADRGMTAGEIRKVIAEQARAAGVVDAPVSGYSLRRSWATHTYLRDRDSIGQIALQLRHRRVDTTIRYIEDLATHLLDGDDVLSDRVVAGPGGVTTPVKDLGFDDRPLASLAVEVSAALAVPAGLGPATVNAIAHYWDGWQRWCDGHGFEALPAELSAVLLFATERADAGIAPNTLRAQLRAIQRIHDDNGISTVGFGRVTAELIAGLERGHVATRRQAPVIPIDVLVDMAEHASTAGVDDVKALRDLVMVCVGYAGGLRADDLCRARLEWLEPMPGGMVLRLAASKLNPSGRRSEAMFLAGRDDVLDPVAAIKTWMARMGLDAGPLLPSLPLLSPSRPMSKDGVGDRLARLAAATGCPVRPTGHSLRRSWATHAYEAGLDLLSISRHLRHRRVTGTRTYVQSLTPWPDNPGPHIISHEE